jgi:hypothetical protein
MRMVNGSEEFPDHNTSKADRKLCKGILSDETNEIQGSGGNSEQKEEKGIFKKKQTEREEEKQY